MQYCAKCGAELKKNTNLYLLLQNLESPRYPRRDKKSKTRVEENMGGATGLLVIPFSVRCVIDCELWRERR